MHGSKSSMRQSASNRYFHAGRHHLVRASAISAKRAGNNNHQRRRAPGGKENEPDKCDAKIFRSFDRTRPERIVERRTEKAHDSGIHSAHRGLSVRSIAQIVPKRQCAEKNQNAGKKDAKQPKRCAGYAMRRRAGDGTEIGSEGEERSRDRLRCAITARKASSLTHPGVTNASRSNGSTTWPPPKTSAPER